MAVGDIDDGVLLQSNELVVILCDATTCVAVEKKLLLPLVTIVIF